MSGRGKVLRRTRLAPAPGLTIKEMREGENEEALGGMRNPAESLKRLPSQGHGCIGVRRALADAINNDETALAVVLDILSGVKTSGFHRDLKAKARANVRQALGLWPSGGDVERSGLQPDVIEAMSALMIDPDSVLAHWLRHGAPLGASVPVEHTGVFPLDTHNRLLSPDELAVAEDVESWENYSTAEEDPMACGEILDTMVQKGWSIVFEEPSEAEAFLGVSGLVLNRLGLIRKVKPDGTVKYRIVWDLRRSGVNLVILQGERVVLPRIADIVDSIREVGVDDGQSQDVYMLGTDISDAFHQVPLDGREWQYTAAAFRGKIYIFKVLVFGSVSAPTVWGRYAAWLGRSTAAVLLDTACKMHIYVDDPIYVASGSREECARSFAMALLWAEVVGFPLAWHKCDGGTSLEWIGARISVTSGFTQVSIPEAKVSELKQICSGMLGSSTTTSREVRKLAGKCGFVAGLVPTMNPFIRSLWKMGANRGAGRANDTSPPGAMPQGRRGRALPTHLVFVSQIKRDLTWIAAFMARQRGTLTRVHPWTKLPESKRMRVSVDASPWGIGGVLSEGVTPVAYFADDITTEDLRRFQASRGDSAFNTVWEALAILVGLRVWRELLGPLGSFEVRSDSLGALGATLRGSAKSPRLNVVIAEIMLDEAELSTRIEVLEHIPGVSNVWPDALSRLGAPEPKQLPEALALVRRTPCPVRGADFWIAQRLPDGPS